MAAGDRNGPDDATPCGSDEQVADVAFDGCKLAVEETCFRGHGQDGGTEEDAVDKAAPLDRLARRGGRLKEGRDGDHDALELGAIAQVGGGRTGVVDVVHQLSFPMVRSSFTICSLPVNPRA